MIGVGSDKKLASTTDGKQVGEAKAKKFVNKPNNVVIVLLSENVAIVKFQKEIKEKWMEVISAQKVEVDQRQALACEN